MRERTHRFSYREKSLHPIVPFYKKVFVFSKLVAKFYAKPREKKCLQKGRVTKVIRALKLTRKLNRTKAFHFYSAETKFMGGGETTSF